MEDKENILDFIFDARSENLAQINENDLKILHSKNGNIDKKYKNFQNSLDNIPDTFANSKKDILNKFNEYSDTADYVHGYFYKKYYKMGFSECLKLILNCINI